MSENKKGLLYFCVELILYGRASVHSIFLARLLFVYNCPGGGAVVAACACLIRQQFIIDPYLFKFFVVVIIITTICSFFMCYLIRSIPTKGKRL